MTPPVSSPAPTARSPAPLPADAVANATISDAPAAEAVNEVVTDLAGNEARDVAITTALAEAVVTVPPGLVATGQLPRRVRASGRRQVTAAAAPVVAEEPVAESRPSEDCPPHLEAVRRGAPAAAPVASGSSLVQIGAGQRSAGQGRMEPGVGQPGALFAGKGMVIQKHETNGRAFGGCAPRASPPRTRRGASAPR